MKVEDFLRQNITETKPVKGMLLLSAPMMVDNFFTRSVVLLIQDGKDSSHSGLILNHRINVSLHEVIEDLPEMPEIPLFNGGPVELNKMFMLHKLPDISGSIEILPGLYTGGNSDQLWEYITSGKPTEGMIRLFFGISGWDTNQLTKEILEGSWAVNQNPDPTGLLTGDGDEFWRRQVKELGESYRSWLSMPIHPSYN